MAIPDNIPTPDENSNEKSLPPPDLVPRKGGIRRPSLENRSNQSVEQSVEHSVEHSAEQSSVSSKDDNEDPPTESKVTESSPWTLKRSLCCLGWILCFPLCCGLYFLRERPVDEDDLRDDDCLPCYPANTVPHSNPQPQDYKET